MAGTLLSLVQQAAGEMSLPVPTSVVSSTTREAQTLYRLANAMGYELVREFDWEALQTQYIFQVSVSTITATTTSGSSNLTNCSSISGITSDYQISGLGINQATYVSGTPSGTTIGMTQPATSSNTAATYTLTKVKYALPTDWDRQIDRTHWDKSKHWEMLGPLTPQQWEWLISGYISTGPRVRYRIFGEKFQIWPALGSAEVLGFEYMTKNWARSTLGVAQAAFTADTDTCIFPDRLMVLGIKKKYFEVKGFGDIYTKDYQEQLDIAKANDAGSQTLSFAPRVSSILIGWENIPDSFPNG